VFYVLVNITTLFSAIENGMIKSIFVIYYFTVLIRKKTASEAHRFISKTYFESASSITTSDYWFRRFKNNDFDRPKIAQRKRKVILLHDNARSHVAKVVKDTLSTLQWEILPHTAYSPDCASSDYHLFLSLQAWPCSALQNI